MRGRQMLRAGPVIVRGEECRTAAQVSGAWSRALGNTVDGRGIVAQAHDYPKGCSWVSSGTRLMSGGDYVRAVRVRCAAVATPLRASRGRPVQAACPDCQAPCSLGHISQTCPRVHGLRVRRHDDVVAFTKGRLVRKGFTVMQEPTIPFQGTYRKPDLVVWKPGGAEAFIVDAQVTSDSFPLHDAHARKVAKYDLRDLRDHVSALSGCPVVHVASLTLSWRECWAAESASVLRALGLTIGDLQIISIKALTWTDTMCNVWRKAGRMGGT